jgi:hypothetical protein
VKIRTAGWRMNGLFNKGLIYGEYSISMKALIVIMMLYLKTAEIIFQGRECKR